MMLNGGVIQKKTISKGGPGKMINLPHAAADGGIIARKAGPPVRLLLRGIGTPGKPTQSAQSKM